MIYFIVFILILILVVIVLGFIFYFTLSALMKSKKETKEYKNALERQADYIRQVDQFRSETRSKKDGLNHAKDEALIDYGNDLFDRLRNDTGGKK